MGDAPIHRAFFEQMAVLDVDQEPPPSRVTVIMGREDKTVPFAIVEETWASWASAGRLVGGSQFIALEGGDHSLVAHSDIIRDAIVRAVRDS